MCQVKKETHLKCRKTFKYRTRTTIYCIEKNNGMEWNLMESNKIK